MNWIEDDKPQSTSPDWIETFNAPILTKSTYTPEIGRVHLCSRCQSRTSMDGQPSQAARLRYRHLIGFSR
jgi:hypothetical protein